MKKIEHLGIAVSDLEASERLFETLFNVKVYKREFVESQEVMTSFLRVGNNKIELLKATSDNSVIQKFIDKKGEGFHHVAFAVSNIKAEMERLKDAGYQLLSETPQKGADNKMVCFLHPKTTNGLLVELVEDLS
jgi:methylmalonyl-CoA/ethylmalonyl-CoA epimerase